jgi:hypothetical protein
MVLLPLQRNHGPNGPPGFLGTRTLNFLYARRLLCGHLPILCALSLMRTECL